MAELNSWDTTAANNNDTPPDGWPESTMQYSEVNDTAREGMAVVARYFQDINGTLQFAGPADAYTLTLNAGYAAYFQGMYFAAEINTLNTGASTVDVNGLGVKSIVDVSGSALGAGDLQAGGIYEFRYDGTNFQIMGESAGGSLIVRNMEIRADIVTATPPTTEAVTAKLDFFDLDGTDPLGLAGFDGSNSLRFLNRMHGGSVILSAEDAGGTLRTLLSGQPDASLNFFYAGVFKGGTSSVGLISNTDIVTATPPTTEAVNGSFRIFDLDQDDELARFGFSGSNELAIRNKMHAGTFVVSAENAAAAETILFSGDPELSGGSFMYFGGIKVLGTVGAGTIDIIGGTNSDVGGVKSIRFRHADLTRRGTIGWVGVGALSIQNEVHGANVEITGEDTGGTERSLFEGDPDGNAQLFHIGVSVARTETAANGGLEVNNASTGGGFERVLTTSDLGAPAPQTKFKSADESVVSSETLQDDDHFTGFALVAGKHYMLQGLIRTGPGSGGLKILWVFSETPQQSNLSYVTYSGGGVQADEDVHDMDVEHDYSISADPNMIRWWGLFEANASTGGTLKLQWAQAATSVTPRVLFEGSYVQITALD
jgi:hypothetical protein